MTERPTSDIAFTDAVKSAQQRLGSRDMFARLEQQGGWHASITDELASFIAARDSLYFATASADGQPYVQHRGGPKGFVKVLDPHTLAFADYSGNQQYLSVGNLSENEKAFL
ncbi:MAG: pyridoxamine 5'-phosphate oxidase family protein [Rhodospirillaceae bacterium]|nr:pyridoxamine 5'-phosphate oxidase family protein [Rhodospirillaceae bacterium]